MATSTTLHEPAEHLTEQTIDIHRAIVSLIEELEAVDWYNQRAEATKDPQLQSVIEHNRRSSTPGRISSIENRSA